MGVFFPGGRESDSRLRRYGLTMVVITALLAMVRDTLADYRAQNVATQVALRASLDQLPVVVRESMAGIKEVLVPIASDVDSIKDTQTEIRGWVQGRLKCPACVCPDVRTVRMRIEPMLKDGQR